MKAKAKKKLPVIERLGVFRIGYMNVEVILDWDQTGGSFYTAPDASGPPRIRIGMDYQNWQAVVTVALHEAMEFALVLLDLRYEKSGSLADNAAAYWFNFDHQEFAEALAITSSFLTPCLPQLAAKYNERHPAKGK